MVELDAFTGDLGSGAASGTGCCTAGLTNASGDSATAVTASGAGAGDLGDGAASGAGCCTAGWANASGDSTTAITASGAEAGDWQ